MAHANKRGKRWWGSWKGPNGERVRKPLPGVTSKREAEQIANAHEAKATRVRAGLDSALDNSAEAAPLVEGFLLAKLAGTSYQNARHYYSALADTLGQFKTRDGHSWPPRKPAPFDEVRGMERTFHPGSLGVLTVAEITPERVEQYIEENRGRLKTRTLDARLTALKAVLEWARRGKKTASNPLAEMSRVGTPGKNVRFLTAEQVAKLLNASAGSERTTWLFFVSTGLRKGEFINLCWPSVTLSPTPAFPHGFVRVVAVTSKSKRQRDIPLTPELRHRLLALRETANDPQGHVFVNSTGRPWHNNLPRKLRGALKRAGMKPNQVSLHGLRHTFATGLLLNGANIITVSKLLGHKDVTQTLNTYAHVLPENLRQAMDHLPFGVTTESQSTAAPTQLVA